MNRHGLWRRGGWLWIVIPCLAAALILGGVAHATHGPAGTLGVVAGVVLIAIPVELVLREIVVVRRARRVHVQPRYTHARSHRGGVAQLVVLCLVGLAIGLVTLVVGIDKQRLRHDPLVQVTVQRSTLSCGRSCSYDSYVTFDLGGRHFANVDVDDEKQRASGDTFSLFVDPHDVSDTCARPITGGPTSSGAGSRSCSQPGWGLS